MKMKLFILVIFITALVSCQKIWMKPKQTLRIKGSDTMYILAEVWAINYMKAKPNVAVYVEGGGSATGFEALSKNECDIAMSSRLIKTAEAQKLAKSFNKIGLLHLVAKDALSVYVNYSNPIDNLTLFQLKQIFTGEITNWKDLGGKDEKILVVTRPSNSGTYVYFKKFVLGNLEYTPQSIIKESTNSIVQFVSKNQAAVGFGGLAYGPSVKHLKINHILPIDENVRQDKYPLSRYLYLYTASNPKGETANFINWALSNKGQKIVEQIGYTSIWPSTLK
jgi:phosphate transport system substrate-binding protein